MAKKTNLKNLADEITDISEKKKMADLVVSQIRSTFGQGSIIKMSEVVNPDVQSISSGSLAVDIATGIGGFPTGRVVEIYGPESSGKTSLTLAAIASSQKEGGIAAFVDAEHAFDPNFASRFGVQVDDLYVSQPNNGEEALDIVDNLVRSNAFDVIVIDSVAALVPKSEIEGNMGDSSMGVQARLMSQALRKLTGVISKSKTVVIFINQIRLKIGVMFGNPETTTGGQALKFYASQRFDVRKIGKLTANGVDVGVRIKVKVVKNKVAAPFKVAEYDLMFNEPGVISLAGEVIDHGQEFGVVVKTGNTFTLKIEGQEELKLGVGRENAKKELYTHPDLILQAKKEILEKFRHSIKNDSFSNVNSDSLAQKDDEDLLDVED
jgi:recombination protein RecA